MIQNFFTINVDGNLIKVFKMKGFEQLNLLQYLQKLGKDIPHFCYHERLGIAGNCRMCLIQTNLAKKLQVACSLVMSEGLIVNMLSARVKRAQEAVLGFLLSNHPLDCPICDQGGECDLQDLTLLYGADRNSFYETEKRSVLDKNFGVLIKSSMNRCIHCMRCVRFYKDVVGVPILGALGRGFKSEIDTYIYKFLDDEFSGNIIDLCPVGALTAKIYAFQYRSWELQNVKTIDFLDSLYAPISFNVFGNKLIRVLPEMNYLVNDNWITNKTRFAYELLNLKRVSKSIWFINKSKILLKNEYLMLTYDTTIHLLLFLFLNIKWNYIFPVISSIIDVLDLYSFKNFFNSIGVNKFFSLENSTTILIDIRNFYLLYWGLEDFKYYSSCILFCINPRMEAPLLNLKFRQLWLNNKVLFLNFGPTLHSTSFNIVTISKDLFALFFLLEGKTTILRSFFYNITNFLPFFFWGASILKHPMGSNLFWIFLMFIMLLQRNLNLANYWRFFYKGFNFFSLFSLFSLYSITLSSNEFGLISNEFFKSIKRIFSAQNSFKNFGQKKPLKLLFFFFGLGNWNRVNNYFLEKNNNFCIYQGLIFESLDYVSFDLLIPNLGFYEKNSIAFSMLKSIQETAPVFNYDTFLLSAEIFFKNVYNLFRNYFFSIFYSSNLFHCEVNNVFCNLYKNRQNVTFLLNVSSLCEKRNKWISSFFLSQRIFYLYKEKFNFLCIKSDIFNFYFNRYLIKNVVFLTNTFANNYLLNYFDESDSFFIKNSKTMNLCMLSYSKRNFSFFF